MLSYGDSLFNQHVKVLGDLRSEAGRLQDTEDLVTSDYLDLRNTMGVTKDDADLRRCSTLTGELADLINDLVRSGLQPARRSAAVRDSGSRYPLSIRV